MMVYGGTTFHYGEGTQRGRSAPYLGVHPVAYVGSTYAVLV